MARSVRQHRLLSGSQNGLAQVRTGDFNADGKPDLSVSDYYNLYVLFNTRDFTFKTVKVADAPDGIFGVPVDVNQDGFTDLLVTYYRCSNLKTVSCPTSMGTASTTLSVWVVAIW
ncbi:MAG TPA: VCBS repeat-containing protein [Candidatus Sulfotelmatobacter sp.]